MYTRRDFIKNAAFGGSALFVFGNFGILGIAEAADQSGRGLSMVVVDYNKCAGCRTCEAACSSFNHKTLVDGELLRGLGNPFYANIRVQNFNPDADVPAVCAMCPDSPCISSCPVAPDAETGRKALYRDSLTHAITNDQERCLGCKTCAGACRANRVGVILPNPATGKPERMCTLCGGDPQCVKLCPQKALRHTRVRTLREFYGMSPEKIAEQLAARWYE